MRMMPQSSEQEQPARAAPAQQQQEEEEEEPPSAPEVVPARPPSSTAPTTQSPAAPAPAPPPPPPECSVALLAWLEAQQLGAHVAAVLAQLGASELAHLAFLAPHDLEPGAGPDGSGGTEHSSQQQLLRPLERRRLLEAIGRIDFSMGHHPAAGVGSGLRAHEATYRPADLSNFSRDVHRPQHGWPQPRQEVYDHGARPAMTQPGRPSSSAAAAMDHAVTTRLSPFAPSGWEGAEGHEAHHHDPEWAVSRPFPSWNRSILTEIYLCHACSCHEILRTETAGQGGGAPQSPSSAHSWAMRRAPPPPHEHPPRGLAAMPEHSPARDAPMPGETAQTSAVAAKGRERLSIRTELVSAGEAGLGGAEEQGLSSEAVRQIRAENRASRAEATVLQVSQNG
jgi:hypothetical protein